MAGDFWALMGKYDRPGLLWNKTGYPAPYGNRDLAAPSAVSARNTQRERGCLPNDNSSCHFEYPSPSESKRMKLKRYLLVALAAACQSIAPAFAQDWPTQPVRIIVPFAAGGGTDGMARLVADELSRQLSQSFVIENRPGAGGISGTDAVVRSRKDGHTILFTTPSLAYSKLQFSKLPYDPEADLTPAALVGYAPYVMVANNDFPARDPKSLVAMLKAAPGKYDFGSAGVGTATHFVFELFLATGGDLKLTHVAYKGSPAAMTDLIAGNIPLLIDPASGVMPYATSGRVRPIGVTSSNRLAGLPNVPTFKEAGFPELEVYGWYMTLVPTGTPEAVVRKISAAVRKVVTSPAISKKMADVNVDVPPESASTPEGSAKFLASEFTKWTAVAKRAGIKPQ